MILFCNDLNQPTLVLGIVLFIIIMTPAVWDFDDGRQQHCVQHLYWEFFHASAINRRRRYYVLCSFPLRPSALPPLFVNTYFPWCDIWTKFAINIRQALANHMRRTPNGARLLAVYATRRSSVIGCWCKRSPISMRGLRQQINYVIGTQAYVKLKIVCDCHIFMLSEHVINCNTLSTRNTHQLFSFSCSNKIKRCAKTILVCERSVHVDMVTSRCVSLNLYFLAAVFCERAALFLQLCNIGQLLIEIVLVYCFSDRGHILVPFIASP